MKKKMKNSRPYALDQRPVVELLSDQNLLSLSLVKLFLKNSCRVKIVSEKEREWKQEVAGLKDESYIEFAGSGVSQEQVDYIVSISFLDRQIEGGRKSFAKERTKTLLASKQAKKYSAKSLFVFPLVSEQLVLTKVSHLAKKILSQKKINTEILYVGQLIGSGMALHEKALVNRMIKDAFGNRAVRIPQKKVLLYPALVDDVARKLLKILFSFGLTGRELAIVPTPISAKDFYGVLGEIKPGLDFKYDKKTWKTAVATFGRKKVLETDLKKGLKETLEWYVERQAKNKTKVLAKRRVSVVRPTPRQTRRVGLGLVAFGVVLLTPFILAVLSATSLAFAKNKIETGNLSLAKKAFVFSRATAKVFEAEATIIAKTPFIGKAFWGIVGVSRVLVNASEVGHRSVLVAGYSAEFIQKIFGDEVYDPVSYSEKIVLELGTLYEDLGFLEGEIGNLDDIGGLMAKGLDQGLDLEKTREVLLLGKRIVKEAPSLLGQEMPATYLVLFQNNMELRPTGGFIGSFALLTFDKGRLVDVSVSDVYSADGQLKGHVEPPPPIKSYLGEAGWFLRDVNWDPDFPTTASRAEWFLDKEIDVSVDGVVGVDLEVIKKILSEIGPIRIVDFDEEVSAKNLYQLTQAEVEEGFFPGSRKKKDFLTALTRELLLKIPEIDQDKYLSLSRAVFESLEGRHLQFFLHNTKAQRAVATIGWDGSVSPTSTEMGPKGQSECLENCFSDWLGIVDANLGVNKSNRFIKRKAVFAATFNESLVERYLTIIYENSAKRGTQVNNKYKSYTRVLVPPDAIFGPVEISEGQNFKVLELEIDDVRGHKEAGILIEVPPGESRVARFYWKSSLDISYSISGEHRFYWRKQAGTLNDQVVVKFSFPEEVKVYGTPPFSLTEARVVGYNTELSRDFVSRIHWQ